MTTEQDILNKIPNLKWYPFIGKEYENGVSDKKILLVGESHYLPKGSTVNLDSKEWYQGTSDKLTPDERRYIDTAGVLDGLHHNIFKTLNRALIESKH